MSRPSPLRVCMFSHYFPPHFSGAAFQAIALAKALAEHGVHFFFLTVDDSSLPRHTTYAGFPVHRIAGGDGKHREVVLWWNMLRQLAAERAHFDILHATGSTYRTSALGPIARLLGKRSLTTVSLAHDDLALIGRSWAGALQLRFLQTVHRYVAFSDEIIAELRGLPLDGRKVVRIPQGVDTDRFRPATTAERSAFRAELGLPAGDLLAVYAGVIDHRKNVEWLVRTWSTHRQSLADATLLVVGPASRHRRDHDLRATLETFVNDEHLNRHILFRDFTPRIENYLRAADVFILPSANEGMPNVVLEAMACGLPCLVTRISGTPDLITQGESGFLFGVQDEHELLEPLTELIHNAPARRALGAAARARILNDFSMASIVPRYLAVYAELMDHR